MGTPLEDLLQLPKPERARYARALIESLDDEPDAGADEAWSAEIERRATALDAGEAELMEWSELRAQALARLDDEAR